MSVILPLVTLDAVGDEVARTVGRAIGNWVVAHHTVVDEVRDGFRLRWTTPGPGRAFHVVLIDNESLEADIERCLRRAYRDGVKLLGSWIGGVGCENLAEAYRPW